MTGTESRNKIKDQANDTIKPLADKTAKKIAREEI